MRMGLYPIKSTQLISNDRKNPINSFPTALWCYYSTGLVCRSRHTSHRKMRCATSIWNCNSLRSLNCYVSSSQVLNPNQTRLLVTKVSIYWKHNCYGDGIPDICTGTADGTPNVQGGKHWGVGGLMKQCGRWFRQPGRSEGKSRVNVLKAEEPETDKQTSK